MEQNIENNDIDLPLIQEVLAYNNSLVKTNIDLYGNKTIIALTVLLLTYIRHALNNNAVCLIKVDVCRTLANPDFMMTVNGFQVPDLVTKNKIQIN